MNDIDLFAAVCNTATNFSVGIGETINNALKTKIEKKYEKEFENIDRDTNFIIHTIQRLDQYEMTEEQQKKRIKILERLRTISK